LILLAVLLVGYNYWVYSVQNEAAAARSVQSGVSQAANDIQTYLEDLKSVSLIPIARRYEDYDLPLLLRDIEGERKLLHQTDKSLQSLSEDILGFKKAIHSVIFVTPSGWYYAAFQQYATAADFDVTAQPWFESMLASSGEIHYIQPYYISYKRDLQQEEKQVFAVARAIVEIPSAQVVGIMLINTDTQIFASLEQRIQLYEHQRMILLDENNVTVYNSEAENIGQPASQQLLALINAENATMDSVHYLYAVETVPLSQWRVINLVPSAVINQDLRWMSTFTAIMVCLIVIISILVSRAMARQISNPLKRLVHTMELTEKGDLTSRVPIEHTDEIGMLSLAFNRMLDEVNRLVKVVYTDKLMQKELELSMLQSQINPHFLYNTLESISMMAEVNNDTQTAQMAASLGRILRYGLSKDGAIVTLGEELYVLKQYILLQQQRLSHQFKIEESVDSSLYKHPILRLTLQPIVENAINHGMKTVKRNGLIRITAQEMPGCILVHVSDNGSGIPPEQLEKLITSIADPGNDTANIGLRNVNRRIKLNFSEEYGITIQSTIDAGTTVTVKLPKDCSPGLDAETGEMH